MPKNKPLQIAVSGSLAYDKIMDFPGRFSDHILAGRTRRLNVSFPLAGLHASFGGTAGNIAYNLNLLKIKPIILGVVGSDFFSYRLWLKRHGLDTRFLAVVRGLPTAAAHIITDQDDNQISAFYPGPVRPDCVSHLRHLKKPAGAIVAADDKDRLLAYAALWRRRQVPYIFDPGQALTLLAAKELQPALFGARALIVNDYELALLLEKTRLRLAALERRLPIIVVTKGARGSDIYQSGKKISIAPAKPKNTSDPTGAGDAYRAGFIAGLVRGWDLKTCGQLAATVAAYTVEKFGTQTHSFTLAGLARRYYQNYRERINL